MAAYTISHSEGSGGASITVTARLKPGTATKVSDSTAVTRQVSTTANGSGDWSLSLEANGNITPYGSWWEIERALPASAGGAQVHAIAVGTANATLMASVVTPDVTNPPSTAAFLTQATGDLRYQSKGAGSANLNIVNVKDYGAIGDGVTDDTGAIQAAIAATKTNPRTISSVSTYAGGTVYFPKGQYLITHSTLAIADIVGLTFEGQGSRGWSNEANPPTTIIVDGTGSSASSFGIKLEGTGLNTVRNINFTDIAIQYSNSFAGDLIRGRTNGVSGLVMTRCSLGSTSSSGPRPYTANSLINMKGGHHFRFNDTTFTDAVYGVYADNVSSAATNGWKFSGCSFFDFSYAAIYTVGDQISGFSVEGGDVDPVTSGTVLQYGFRLNANGFHIGGVNFGGSNNAHMASVAVILIDGGQGAVVGNSFISSQNAPCVYAVAGITEVTANEMICRKGILTTDTASVTGHSNRYQHSTADVGDIAVHTNNSGNAFFDLGPDLFTESAACAVFGTSYQLSGSPIGSRLNYYRQFDDSTNGPQAYLLGGGVTINGLDVRGRDLNGAVTLKATDTGAFITPSASGTYALPTGFGGLEFTFLKPAAGTAITVNRASTDIIFDGTAARTSVANATAEVGAQLKLRAIVSAAGATWWLVVAKSGSWTFT